MIDRHPRFVSPRFLALRYLGLLAAAIASLPAGAVRINPDGHGQALLYPYYTARSSIGGRAFVTAFSVTNDASRGKALRVRLYEGRAGAPTVDFNLFLAAGDMWAAGIVAAGVGAGIFTADHSCTVPAVSRDSAAPTLFRNGAYAGVDAFGDSLDRTYEGYFEILEMGAIDPASALAASITPRTDLTAPGASKPTCANLPVTTAQPAALLPPEGRLFGDASYVNVTEGSLYGVNAIALSQWSDTVQWSPPGSAGPTLADANPAISTIVDAAGTGDAMIVTQWTTGRDAVSALFMAEHVLNTYSVEAEIDAATDWIVTMPTRRHYAGAPNSIFLDGRTATATFTEQLTPTYPDGTVPPGLIHDREAQDASPQIICFAVGCVPIQKTFVGVTGAWSWVGSARTSRSGVIGSKLGAVQLVPSPFFNGYGRLQIVRDVAYVGSHALAAPSGATTIVDARTASPRAAGSAVYRGLPMVGFALQTFSTRAASGAPLVFGSASPHRFVRNVEFGQ